MYICGPDWQSYDAEVIFHMPKDSQLDNKQDRNRKANNGPTSAQSACDGESRNAKNQSGNREKANNDR